MKYHPSMLSVSLFLIKTAIVNDAMQCESIVRNYCKHSAIGCNELIKPLVESNRIECISKCSTNILAYDVCYPPHRNYTRIILSLFILISCKSVLFSLFFIDPRDTILPHDCHRFFEKYAPNKIKCSNYHHNLSCCLNVF